MYRHGPGRVLLVRRAHAGVGAGPCAAAAAACVAAAAAARAGPRAARAAAAAAPQRAPLRLRRAEVAEVPRHGVLEGAAEGLLRQRPPRAVGLVAEGVVRREGRLLRQLGQLGELRELPLSRAHAAVEVVVLLAPRPPHVREGVAQLLPEQPVSPLQHRRLLEVEPQVWVEVAAGANVAQEDHHQPLRAAAAAAHLAAARARR